MHLIALFARADHPDGLGYPSAGDRARAHGYSVLAVRCPDQTTLDRVTRKLTVEGFQGIDDTAYHQNVPIGEWFGGHFDLVAVLSGEGEAVDGLGPFRMLGDNRFCGLMDAEQVAPSAPQRRLAHNQSAFTRL